jgi:hypothetical protein
MPGTLNQARTAFHEPDLISISPLQKSTLAPIDGGALIEIKHSDPRTAKDRGTMSPGPGWAFYFVRVESGYTPQITTQ